MKPLFYTLLLCLSTTALAAPFRVSCDTFGYEPGTNKWISIMSNASLDFDTREIPDSNLDWQIDPATKKVKTTCMPTAVDRELFGTVPPNQFKLRLKFLNCGNIAKDLPKDANQEDSRSAYIDITGYAPGADLWGATIIEEIDEIAIGKSKRQGFRFGNIGEGTKIRTSEGDIGHAIVSCKVTRLPDAETILP